MKENSVVLLSAGLDSSYNLFRAARETQVLLALSFDYGQRAARRETERASGLCDLLKIPHKILTLSWFKDFTRTALVNPSAPLPGKAELDITSERASKQSAQAVWVPNRNGIFLNIAAAFAESLGARYVIPGFNKEEAATFADNSEAYMEAQSKAFRFSTQNHVEVKCYSSHLDKSQIVQEAVKLNLPFEKLWPCYQAGEQWCRECESCQRFLRALHSQGIQL